MEGNQVSTRLKLYVVVPTSAGDIEQVKTQLTSNAYRGTGLTLTTGEGYNVDVVLEGIDEFNPPHAVMP